MLNLIKRNLTIKIILLFTGIILFILITEYEKAYCYNEGILSNLVQKPESTICGLYGIVSFLALVLISFVIGLIFTFLDRYNKTNLESLSSYSKWILKYKIVLVIIILFFLLITKFSLINFVIIVLGYIASSFVMDITNYLKNKV